MAEHLTQFSCMFDVGAAENAVRAEAIRGELAAELYREDGVYSGFAIEADHAIGPGALWIYSDGFGEPEHVIRFVLRCAEAFDLQGVWGFTWAHFCSKPWLNAFGGGGHVIDLGKRTTLADLDCATWMSLEIDANEKSSEAPSSTQREAKP